MMMKLVAGHSWQVEQIFLSLRLMLMLPEGRKKKMRKKRPKKQRRKALEEEGATLDRRQDIFERKQSKKTRNKKSVICLINRQEPIKAATSKRIVAKMKPREDCCRVWVSNKGRKLHLAWLATFALFVLLATCNSQLKASTLADFDGATFYKAPLGSRVRIACNGSHWSDDSVSLVLWFKGTIERHSVPIYTVDARQRPLNNGARHFVSDAYKHRAKFVTKTTPPYLDLALIEADDQSEYRCRIDYRSKPRENFLIILFVLVPPKSVHIMDSKGRSLEQIYGPLSESSNLTLVCISKGGRPAPAITWRLPSSSGELSPTNQNEKRHNEAPTTTGQHLAKVIDDSYLTLNDFLALKRTGQLLVGAAERTNRTGPGSGFGVGVGDNNNGRNNIISTSGWRTNTSASANNSNEHLDDEEQLIAIKSSNWLATFDASSSHSGTPSSSSSSGPNGSTLPTSTLNGANSINADSSFAQLESLWLNWRNWPEYEFYSRKLDEFGQQQQQQQQQKGQLSWPTSNSVDSKGDQEALFVKLNHEQRKRANLGAGSGSGTSNGQSEPSAQSQQQRQLLTMDFHESITTSVNVLSLANLNVPLSLLTPSIETSNGPPLEPSATSDFSETKAQRPEDAHSILRQGISAGKPLLECEASNLHYDLRTLIKLFAPPSLLGQTGSPGHHSALNSNTNNQVMPDKVSEENLERQLVEAMQRALEATLRVGNEAGSSLATNKQASNEANFSQGANSANLAAALRQIKTETNHSLGQQQAELFVQSNQLNSNNLSQQQTGLNIIYQQLSRAHQLSSTTSAAQAHNEEHNPLVRNRLIALDVYLRPLDVRIEQQQRPLSAGKFAEFSCSSRGSQPPAKLTWLKSGQLIDFKLSRQINEFNGSTSHSKLRLQLESRDHNAQLVCRAENEHLGRLKLAGSESENPNEQEQRRQQSVLEDSITLSVHYSPKVKLELGNKMLTNAIREGSDMYFVCNVEAVPPVREITWLHNKRPVNETSRPATSSTTFVEGNNNEATNNIEGLIISNNSLVLQRVKVEQGGQYACLASNSEDISESNRIELTVLHAPICGHESRLVGGSSEQRLIHGALFVGAKSVALRSSVRLLCQMEANPAQDLEISWYLNNSHTERRAVLGPVKSEESLLLENHNNSNDDHDDESNNQNHNSNYQGDKDQANQWRAQSSEQSNPERADKSAKTHTSRLASLGQSEAAELAKLARKKFTKGSSQLNYLVDTNLDYGYLYCVARNSIGEQKRACVYEIRQPAGIERGLDENSGRSESSLLECMALNVSSSSVWIGCDTRQPDIQATNEDNYRFFIQVYKISDQPNSFQNSQGELNLVDSNEQLEANLTSGPLRGPIFLLNNLQPSTSYALHVRSIESSSSSLPSQVPLEYSMSSIVRFSTRSPQEADERVAEHSSSGSFVKLTVEPVIEPHQSKLLSALISTRSTNGQQNQSPYTGNNQYPSSGSSLNQQANATGSRIYQHLQQQAGFLGRLWSSTNSMLSSMFHSSSSSRMADNAQGGASNRLIASSSKQTAGKRLIGSGTNSSLMEASNVYLITSVCLILLGSLTLLLLLHRYSSKQSCFLFGSRRERSGRGNRKEGGNRQEQADSPKRNYESTSSGDESRELKARQVKLLSKDSQSGTKSDGSSSGADSESSLGCPTLNTTRASRYGSSVPSATTSLQRHLNESTLLDDQLEGALKEQKLVELMNHRADQSPIDGGLLLATLPSKMLLNQRMGTTTNYGNYYAISQAAEQNQQRPASSCQPYEGHIKLYHRNSGHNMQNNNEASFATLDLAQVQNRASRFLTASSNFGPTTSQASQQEQQQQSQLYNSLCSTASSSSLLLTNGQRKNATKSRSSLCLESLWPPHNKSLQVPTAALLNPPSELNGTRGGRLISDANLLLNVVQATNDGSRNNSSSASHNKNNTELSQSNKDGPSNNNNQRLLSDCSLYPLPSNYAPEHEKYDQSQEKLVVRNKNEELGDDYGDDQHGRTVYRRQRELSHLNSASSSDHQHQLPVKQNLRHQNFQNQQQLLCANAGGYFGQRTSFGPSIESSNALNMAIQTLTSPQTNSDHFEPETYPAGAEIQLDRDQLKQLSELPNGGGIASASDNGKHLLNVLVVQPAVATLGQHNAIRRPCRGQQQARHSSSLISDESSDSTAHCTWSALNCSLPGSFPTNAAPLSTNTTNDNISNENNFTINSNNFATAEDQEMQFIELIPAGQQSDCSGRLQENSIAECFTTATTDANLLNKKLVSESIGSSFNSLQQHQLMKSFNGGAAGELTAAEAHLCLSLASSSLNSANSSSVNDQAGPSPSSLITNTSLSNAAESPLVQDYQVHTMKPRQHQQKLPSILKNSSAKYQENGQQQQQALCLCNDRARDNATHEAEERL